jgi:hypothetical protein
MIDYETLGYSWNMSGELLHLRSVIVHSRTLKKSTAERDSSFTGLQDLHPIQSSRKLFEAIAAQDVQDTVLNVTGNSTRPAAHIWENAAQE